MASEVIEKVLKCIEENRHFVLDAGAGSGKTYTLMETISYLQYNKAKRLGKKQNILCITYTNVAKNEIIERLESNAGIAVSTMHDFLWGFIKQFQEELIKETNTLIQLDIVKHNKIIESAERILAKPKANTNIPNKTMELEKSRKRIERYKDIILKKVEYRSYVALYKGFISHDEVIKLSAEFLKIDFFAKLLCDTYSHILIDEYQDSDEKVMGELFESVRKNKKDSYLVLGLFGDKMQQIYSQGITDFGYEKYAFELIEKKDNFRTCEAIIKANNSLRGDGLEQRFMGCENSLDRIEFVYNLGSDVYLQKYDEIDFNKYTRLFLSHKEIARELGFSRISNIFEEEYNRYANDKLLKTEDAFINYILKNVVELAVNFKKHDYMEVISAFNKKAFIQSDLLLLHQKLNECLEKNEKLKDVIQAFIEAKVLNEKDYIEACENYVVNDKIEFVNALIDVEMNEYLQLYKQITKQTKLQTLHGVKGDEFEKVIVNIREKQPWTKYNFDNLFLNGGAMSSGSDNTHKLFYVACTRAKNALVINYMASTDDEAYMKTMLTNIEKTFGGLISTKVLPKSEDVIQI